MKNLVIGFACLGAGCLAVPVHAGAIAAPTVLTRGAIARAFAAGPPPGHTARAIAPPDAFRYWAVTRRAPGSVEVHEHWVDVILVRSGEARLQTGTDVKGGRDTGGGELRGGRITDPQVRMLHAGDMIVIPAGVAHRFIPQGSRPFEYVTIKTPAAR